MVAKCVLSSEGLAKFSKIFLKIFEDSFSILNLFNIAHCKMFNKKEIDDNFYNNIEIKLNLCNKDDMKNKISRKRCISGNFAREKNVYLLTSYIVISICTLPI